MLTLIAILHILTALLIIVLVLLQDSKGGGLGIGGGSGSQSLFGSTGASNFLVKTTKWMAAVFALTSIGLTFYTNKKEKSVFDTKEAIAPLESNQEKTDSNPKDD